MKYYRITLRQNKGSTELIYPANYQSDIGNYNQNHLYYDDVNGSHCLLISLKDVDAVNRVRTYVEEITEIEAKAISEANEIRTETITDEAKIRRIELNVARGLTLTTDDEKALDPNDPTSGFGKSEIFADRLDKIKLKE